MPYNLQLNVINRHGPEGMGQGRKSVTHNLIHYRRCATSIGQPWMKLRSMEISVFP